MPSTPSEEKWQADLRRLAELFEETPSAAGSTQTSSAETTPMSQSSDANTRPAVLKRTQPGLLRRATRSLLIFGMGVAATLVWQSYGDATKEMIASSYPQFGWLAPQTVGVGAVPEMRAPITTSDSQELLKSILVNLAGLRQSMDQLSADFVATQQQMASEIAKVKGADPDLVDKISSAPPAAPARKPVPVAPQEPPVR
jgi:hypothetical protein